MEKLNLVIDDKIPYIREAAALLGEATYLPGAQISADDVRTADALIVRTRTRIDHTLLEGSRVQFVATATIGFDHIDNRYAREAGIRWTNCPGCNAGSVAQYVATALLLLEEDGMLPQRSDCCVGIVGVGHVGSRVSQLLRHMGFRVKHCDPLRAAGQDPAGTLDSWLYSPAEYVSLEEIARTADVVTLHTPLTREGRHATYHLADAAFFNSLARRPVLINSSRGEVVDTLALLRAMDSGKVGPVVMDTWENEPHPNVELLARAYLATPHIAGYSADGKVCGTRMALAAVARHFGVADIPRILAAIPALPPPEIYYPEGGHDLRSPLGWYDPRRDTLALRSHPEAFERLRGDYPLRREAPMEAYELN